jgi:hypothetical protein
MTMAREEGPLVPLRLVLGILVFLVGGLFLADSVGALNADSALTLWPVGLVALSLVVLLQPDPTNRLVGAVLLVAGIWLLLNAIDVWSYSFWSTWPYLLVLFGAWMLYRAAQMRQREGLAQGALEEAGEGFDSRVAGGDWIGAYAFLDRVERAANGATFAGGDFNAVLGGCDVDLTAASSSRAVVDAFVLLGRVAVTVPAGWRVETRVLPLLSRIVAGASDVADASDTVVVRGTLILGRLEVTHAE